MPRFSFTGFDTGEPVSLSVTQSGVTRTGAVSAWGTDVAGISISTRTAPVVTNPAGIWLEAVNPTGFGVTDPQIEGYTPHHHEVIYIWTVRGSPLSPFTAPVNLAPGWNDPNTAYGPKVAFVFPEPGDYTIDLWCVSLVNGATATAEWSVSVEDADLVYAGTKTICFSDDPAETWSEEVPGAIRAHNFGDVESLLGSAATPPRLLIRRGLDTNAFASRLDLRNGDLLGHVGTWGTGAKPILRMEDTVLFNFKGLTNTQITFADLEFRGDWDAASETGASAGPIQWKTNTAESFHLVWNCDFDGYDTFDPTTQAGFESPSIIANCRVGNYRNFGFLSGGDGNSHLAFVGCDVASNPDAMHGGPKTGAMNNNHGPVRLSDTINAYIGQSSFFSRSGWSGMAEGLADQPCLRLSAGGQRGFFRNLDRVSCEGGNTPIVIQGANSSRVENPGTYLFDKVLILASAKSTGSFIIPQMGGFTGRNIYGVMFDGPRAHSVRWNSAIEFSADNPAADNGQAPMRLYDSTFVSLISPANTQDNYKGWSDLADVAPDFVDVTLENNVIHAPFMDAPELDTTVVTAWDPIDLSTPMPGVTPRFKGLRYNYLPQSGTLASEVAEGQSFVVPYSAITSDTEISRGSAVTTQAYWQTHESTDLRHILALGKTWHAHRGQFAVAFEAGGVRITNTSGSVWEAGKKWTLRLDRSSRLPSMDTTYASPATVPLPRPLAGSAAIDGGDAGLSGYDDFLGAVRPATGNERGAFLES